MSNGLLNECITDEPNAFNTLLQKIRKYQFSKVKCSQEVKCFQKLPITMIFFVCFCIYSRSRTAMQFPYIAYINKKKYFKFNIHKSK